MSDLAQQIESLQTSIDAACETMDQLRAEKRDLLSRMSRLLSSVGVQRICGRCHLEYYEVTLFGGEILRFNPDGERHRCAKKGNYDANHR